MCELNDMNLHIVITCVNGFAVVAVNCGFFVCETFCEMNGIYCYDEIVYE